ncbi:MAG TPA: Fic family protein [Candidatus Paceibacterota bacterium]|nr:Fic family protein [Candidatus Paceibacterota bacterium]
MTDDREAQELIAAYTDAWAALDAYDTEKLPSTGTTPATVSLAAERLTEAFARFKTVLTAMGGAVEQFANEREAGSVAGIVGNVMQELDGKPVYPTVQEQAAHLFYFLVKDHPFVDGNKRCGAYAFIWFLDRMGVLDRVAMPAPALTALTLFVAESNAEEKDKTVGLILQLLKK